MLELKRLTPVLSLFKVTQMLQRRLKEGVRLMFRLGQNWEVMLSFYEFIHALLVSNPEANRVVVDRAP